MFLILQEEKSRSRISIEYPSKLSLKITISLLFCFEAGSPLGEVALEFLTGNFLVTVVTLGAGLTNSLSSALEVFSSLADGFFFSDFFSIFSLAILYCFILEKINPRKLLRSLIIFNYLDQELYFSSQIFWQFKNESSEPFSDSNSNHNVITFLGYLAAATKAVRALSHNFL